MPESLGLLANTALNKMYGVYNLDIYGLNTLANEIKTSSFIDALGETPSEWTLDIKAYPFVLSRTGIGDSKLKIGSFESQAHAGTVIYDTYLLAQNFYYGDYLDNNKYYYDIGKYVNIEFYLPFLSYVNVDVSSIYKKFTHVFLSIDFITGMGTYTLCTTTEPLQNYQLPYTVPINTNFEDMDIVSQYTVDLGVDIPITRTNNADTKRNLLYNIIGSVGTIAAGAVSKNPYILAAGVAGGISSLVRSGAETQVTRAETRSVGGTNFNGFGERDVHVRITKSSPRISNKVNDVGEEWSNYLHQNGAPLVNYVEELFDFIDTGYTELSSFHLDGEDFNRATEQELDELETLLKQGIIL